MTYLDAAHTVLQSAAHPLHYKEITELALAQKLIAPQGMTPAATMGSRLYTDTKQEDSHFVRAGNGRAIHTRRTRSSSLCCKRLLALPIFDSASLRPCL